MKSLFTPKEEAFLIYSIGYLNYFSPLKAEGYIELNVARREERQVSDHFCTIGLHDMDNGSMH